MSFAQEMRDFAAGYKAIAETNRRSRYARDKEDEAEDIYAGYGGDDGKKGGGFLDTLKGMFSGGDKPAEGAVPAPDSTAAAPTSDADPREDIFARLNSSYKAAESKGDLKGMETIMKNIKRLNELPSSSGAAKPVAKPAVKAAPKPAVPETAAPKNYGLPEGGFVPKPKSTLPALPNRVDNEALEVDPEVDKEAYGARKMFIGAVGGLVPEMDEEAIPVTPASYEEPVAEAPVAEAPVAEAPVEEDPNVVTRDMSDMAMPGYAAAFRRASQELTVPAGVPDEAENNSRTAAFLRGDNAAKDEEVKAIDAIIDPQNRLPPQAKSAARVAAIWKYYSERGEEAKAEDLINRLAAHDRRNSQTRGMLAMQAFEDGNLPAAAKIIKDTYEQDLPGADLIQPAVLQNGNIKADVVRDGQVVESVEATPQEFKGLIQQVASGQAHSQQSLNLITQWEANRKAAKTRAQGGGSSGPAIDDDIKRGLLTTRRAYAQALADRDDSPEWQEYFEKVKGAVQAQEDRAIAYADKVGGKDRDKVLRSLGVGNVPTAATVPSPNKGGGRLNQPNVPTKKNKKGEDEVDEVEVLRRRIQNADILEQFGVPIDENGKATVQRDPSYKATKEEIDAARRTIEPIRQRLKVELADRSYQDMDDAPGYKENFKTREDGWRQTIQEYMKNTSPDAAPRKLEKKDERKYLDLIDAIARKNDVNPYRIMQFIDNVTTNTNDPLEIDPRTGKVVNGEARLFVDRETLSALGAMRRETMKATRAKEEGAKAAQAQARDEATVRAIDDSARSFRDQFAQDDRTLAQSTYAPLPQQADEATSELSRREAAVMNELNELRRLGKIGRADPMVAGRRITELEDQLRQIDRQRQRMVPSRSRAPALPVEEIERRNAEFPVRRGLPGQGVMVP